MASLANLVVSLIAETGKFQTDMDRTAKQQAARMKKMQKNIEQSTRAMAQAFTLVAGSMTAVVVSTAKTADSMGKLGQRLGASTEALSELGFAAGKSGVDFRTLEMGLQRMTRRIGEVAFLGKGEAKEALQVLGLEAKELSKLPLDKQFESIAEELSKFGNVSQRTSLAMKIFDAEGVKLVQLMGEGASGIQEARKEAQRFGEVISGRLAGLSRDFNDNLADMAALSKGAGYQFSEGLLPALIGVQNAFLDGAGNASVWVTAGERVGELVVYLSRAFTMLWGIMKTVTAAFLGLSTAVVGTIQAIAAPITAFLKQTSIAAKALTEGDLAGAYEAVSQIATQSGAEFSNAVKNIKRGVDEVAGAGVYFEEAWQKSLKILGEFNAAASDSGEELMTLARAIKLAEPRLKAVEKLMGEINKEFASLSKSKAAKSFDEMTEAADRQFEILGQLVDELESWDQQQQEVQQSGQQLLDTLYPMEAATRDFVSQLELLRNFAELNTWSAERLADAELQLAENFAQTTRAIGGQAQQMDLLAIAVDEGVRILERSFQTLWENLLSGAESSFDSIKTGFKSLLANLVHQATTQKILVNIQQGLQGTGSGPGGGVNFAQLGGDFAAFASILAGSALGGGGQFASMGSAIGFVAGKALVSYLSGTWLALGTIGGPIGIAITSILGGLLGGLFDKDRPAILQVSSFDTSGLSRSDDDSAISTLFGDTFIRSRRIDSAAISDIGQAIEDFDSAFSFLDKSSIDAITQALVGWGRQMEGEAINIEQLLTSRFSVILSTFDQDLQAFVNKGEDLAARMNRLQIGVTVDDIIAAAPELFSGKTRQDFLNVISAFGDGMGDITEGFREVVRLIDIIAPLLQSLQDFAGSNLQTDYQALISSQSGSLTEILAGMNTGLMDAVANFDGSIEALQEIGLMSLAIREAELRLLAQIDGVIAGLDSSLDKLKADIEGLTAIPKTGEEAFFSAADLIRTVAVAQSPEEVAQIGRQFEALIRSLSEEEQIANQSELVRMIEAFRSASTDNLAAQRQEVFDNAEQTRMMLDGFLTRIGDTLDIIAGSNQVIADYLVGGEIPDPIMDNPGVVDDDQGKPNWRDELGDKIGGSIRAGFKNVNVNVIVGGDSGMVNE